MFPPSSAVPLFTQTPSSLPSLQVIGVLDRSTTLLRVTDFVFFMLLAYIQVLFLTKMQAVENNVVGWLLVALLCTKVLFSAGGPSINYLRGLYNRGRITCKRRKHIAQVNQEKDQRGERELRTLSNRNS